MALIILFIYRSDHELVASIKEVSVNWKGENIMDKFTMKFPVDFVTALVSQSPMFFAVFIGVLTGTIRTYTGQISSHGRYTMEQRASVSIVK